MGADCHSKTGDRNLDTVPRTQKSVLSLIETGWPLSAGIQTEPDTIVDSSDVNTRRLQIQFS